MVKSNGKKYRKYSIRKEEGCLLSFDAAKCKMLNSDKMTSESSTFMLEVPVAFAATKPEIDVIPLGIGGKEDPARLIFDGVTGDGIQVTMVDMGDHFRIICTDQR